MRIGMVGLGRMGANMVLRLIKAGHEVVVWDRSEAAVNDLASKGAIAAVDQKDLVSKLTGPKAVWMMIPAAYVDDTIATSTEETPTTRTTSAAPRNLPPRASSMSMSGLPAVSGVWSAVTAR